MCQGHSRLFIYICLLAVSLHGVQIQHPTRGCHVQCLLASAKVWGNAATLYAPMTCNPTDLIPRSARHRPRMIKCISPLPRLFGNQADCRIQLPYQAQQMILSLSLATRLTRGCGSWARLSGGCVLVDGQWESHYELPLNSACECPHCGSFGLTVV